MKRSAPFSCAWRRILAGIHPVDKSVMLFLGVLLLQSAYTMFVPTPAGQGAEEIDIIVRTSAAAILGYVLSGNFLLRSSSRSQSPAGGAAHSMDTEPGRPDGESGEPEPPLSKAEALPGAADAPPVNQEAAVCVQAAVATGIGLFCLVILLFLRNTGRWAGEGAESGSVSASVVQFRDFVSGCVGFLIGHPTASPDSNS